MWSLLIFLCLSDGQCRYAGDLSQSWGPGQAVTDCVMAGKAKEDELGRFTEEASKSSGLILTWRWECNYNGDKS